MQRFQICNLLTNLETNVNNIFYFTAVYSCISRISLPYVILTVYLCKVFRIHNFISGMLHITLHSSVVCLLVFFANSLEQKKNNFLTPPWHHVAPWKLFAYLAGTQVQINVAFGCFLFLHEGNNKGVGSSLLGLKRFQLF